MKYVVEPGEFEILVGNSSRDEDLSKIVLTVN
jgi:beta-glucosidase